MGKAGSQVEDGRPFLARTMSSYSFYNISLRELSASRRVVSSELLSPQNLRDILSFKGVYFVLFQLHFD